MCSPSVKAIVASSRTTWAPYLTERLFALAMTKVSAMGTSNVECPTRLRKTTARQAPHVQSKHGIVSGGRMIRRYRGGRGRVKVMGDKSPKQKQKQAAQKQMQTNLANQRKHHALAAKQGANSPKQRSE